MIRRSLFILFLYVLLVWIIAVYLHLGDTTRLINQGLLWTALGVASLLLWLILERVIGWWRVRHALRASRPAAPRPAAIKPMNEDAAALVSLLNEADQRLAAAAGEPGGIPARALDLPLYLILGPEGAGKTAVLHHCGIEPTLLAGQVLGGGVAIASTRVANLWLAQNSLFLEVSGRVFNGAPERLAEFLSVLQPGSRVTGWRSWLQPPPRPAALRGVLLFFDSRRFGGTPELSELDRAAQQIRERMLAIAGVLGAEFPVYVLFTKTDALPYFAEFFGRLPEAEAGQVFGVLNPAKPEEYAQDRVWAEAETKRLNRQFQSLFLRLSDRRLLGLTQENEAARKPAVYEFPREFKRIRTPLVQFLVDVFKPDPLKAGPRLRGFFFAGTRKTERMAGTGAETRHVHGSPGAGYGATQIFSPEMLASMADPEALLFRKLAPKSGSGQLVDSWMFVTELFQKVLSLDRPAVRRVAAPPKFEQYRKIALGAAAGLALFLGLVWTISWIGNWQLAGQVNKVVAGAQQGSADLSVVNLRALESLRRQLVDLDNNDSLSLHWGLYTGDDLRRAARKAYFERLKVLSLDGINRTLALRMQQAGIGNQGEGAGPTYDRLKTHRTITALGCPVDRALVSNVLKTAAVETHPDLGDDQAALLNLQLEFYAAQLARNRKLPVALAEDPVAEEKARAYLRQASGPEQQLRSLLNDVSSQLKPLVVAERVDYKTVLTGQPELPGVFTREGLAVFEDLVAKGNFKMGGEECVMGDSPGLTGKSMDFETRDRLKSLYYRKYVDAWRDFVGSYKVIRYSGLDDAARKLETLAGARSPLLGIVQLVAVNTNFPAPAAGKKSLLEQGADAVGLGSTVQSEKKAEKGIESGRQLLAGDTPPMTKADFAQLFQPVLFTTPPEVDLLVSDHNVEYVKSLRALQTSLDALGRASTAERATLIPQAQMALAQARAARTALADKFYDVGTGGLNKTLSDLLEQPIAFAASEIPANIETSLLAKKNGELNQFCRDMSRILVKYPFTPSSQTEATLGDLATGFAPMDGLVLKYVQKSAGELAVHTKKDWQPNPALQGVKVAPELLQFLNRAQQLTSAFFAEGGQPKLKYVLRRVPGQTIVVRLVLDGTEINSQDALQKTFYWPAPPGATPGADGIVEAGGATFGFGSYKGLWGVFHLFQVADERADGTRIMQWHQMRGLSGAVTQSFSPAAKIEIVEFPGDVDVFNPNFFKDVQCPKKAVVPN